MKRRRYDPSQPPGSWWVDLDESEKIRIVELYHRRQRIPLSNARVHAAAHVVVEDQVLLGDETPAAVTLQRLISEGLDRHDAIHAIGMELMGIVWEVGTDRLKADPTDKYYRRLEELTAEHWLSQVEEIENDS
jgi:hypothetical protein